MNRLLKIGLLGLMLSVTGCGSGGNAKEQPDPDSTGASPGAVTVQAPSTSPQPALFDCDSDFPLPTVQVEAVLEGVWEGTLVDCASNTSGNVFAYVTKDGRMRVQWAAPEDNGDSFKSVLAASGDAFSGEGRYFDAIGGWSTALRIGGLIRAGTPIIVSDNWIVETYRMEGLWATDAGTYGYFWLDDIAGTNHPPTALQDWPSEWDLWIKVTDRRDFLGGWTIDERGAVKGRDADGCEYAGQFAATEARFFYELNLMITGCALDGTYTGIGRATSGPFNDLLYVAVDDGDQRSLVLLFGSK